MSGDAIEIIVAGTPIAQGSKRHVGKVSIESNRERLLPWRAAVAAKAIEAMDGRDAIAGPIGMRVVFSFARPASHYGTGRNLDVLKPSAPTSKPSKPDLDKLLRALLDGMTGIVYRDDAQVVEALVVKRFGVPSAVVRVWCIES